MANAAADVMPGLLEHQGQWSGVYQHVDIQGNIVDQHQSRVTCIFPDSAEAPDDIVYIQKNHFMWDDGRERIYEFGGVLVGNQICWDTETFSGCGWQASPSVFFLELDRKDIPGASFFETIVMGETKKDRARTWHWFKDGKCYKRTLCNEWLVE